MTSIDKNNEIQTDLYRKSMARNTYLLPRSCHPPHIHKNIPYSLALRIKRICSRDSDFLKRSKELRRMLLARKYKLKDINEAIDRAATMNRNELLKIKNTKTNSKTNFVFCTSLYTSSPAHLVLMLG